MHSMISFHDVLLRQTDVDLLKGPYWLNDQLVAFYFEYLTHEVVPNASLRFLPGAAAFLLKNGTVEDVDVCFVRPLKLKQCDVIFMAVNDNPNVTQAEGGTHWSLLIWVRQECTFVHLDSYGGVNNEPARDTAKKLHAVLSTEGSMKFVAPLVPQQTNGSDCALYLLKFAQILATDLTQWSASQLKILKCVTPLSIIHFRKELLDIIESKRS